MNLYSLQVVFEDNGRKSIPGELYTALDVDDILLV